MREDWFSPGKIRFTRHEVLFLIRNLPTLREGYWIKEGSSYIDIPIGKRSISNKAPFTTPIEYASEISKRLEHCGLDGLILLAIECWDLSEDSLSEYFNMPGWSIRKRAKNALGYVASGPARRWHDIPKRKGESYQEFKERRK